MGSFKDVVGHKDILKYISSAVENNRVSHAYILNGERGSGKKMLANLFAMTLLCETGDNEPCGKCHSCKQAESGNHPDIIRVTHEKPNSISVDDIRTQVNNTVDIKPYQGRLHYPTGRYDDTAGTECDPEDDRGTAVICSFLAADGECGDITSDDQFQMCNVKAA